MSEQGKESLGDGAERAPAGERPGRPRRPSRSGRGLDSVLAHLRQEEAERGPDEDTAHNPQRN